MKRQIIIDSDARKKLQEAFGVTRVTVWKALNYESDNELARKIRFRVLIRPTKRPKEP